jgi:transposase-like protein
MLNNLNLIDDAKYYEVVRNLRWPNGVHCAYCGHFWVKKRGFYTSSKHRQRYVCKPCERQFDDLTNTIFAGHHQPLRVWMLGLYLMGLNLSNRQIAAELGLNKDDVQQMTSQLRSGIVEKKSHTEWRSRA